MSYRPRHHATPPPAGPLERPRPIEYHAPARPGGTALTEAISAAMVGLYAEVYGRANQTTPGIACELFFLEAPPVATA